MADKRGSTDRGTDKVSDPPRGSGRGTALAIIAFLYVVLLTWVFWR